MLSSSACQVPCCSFNAPKPARSSQTDFSEAKTGHLTPAQLLPGASPALALPPSPLLCLCPYCPCSSHNGLHAPGLSTATASANRGPRAAMAPSSLVSDPVTSPGAASLSTCGKCLLCTLFPSPLFPSQQRPLLILISDMCMYVHTHVSVAGPSPPERTLHKGRVLSRFCPRLYDSA